MASERNSDGAIGFTLPPQTVDQCSPHTLSHLMKNDILQNETLFFIYIGTRFTCILLYTNDQEYSTFMSLLYLVGCSYSNRLDRHRNLAITISIYSIICMCNLFFKKNFVR